ncbi:sterol desaturase family protein [Sphingomicrobium sediminis]|uniref:Sterol desaturase family protein n=1 Tax=Sphingomicrobium sediminis TaxID=2950949 RepID=A0A9X2EG59_9SPHN|nr:sterol desaturase family protein [Sphingomicrobium sediminis]MCM8557388.1 sterol desaturase family protein [Sphingomicrobium sediminis]
MDPKSFLVALYAQVAFIAPFLLVITLVEMRFERNSVDMKTRMRGVPQNIIQLGMRIFAGWAFFVVYRELGLSPVVAPFKEMGPVLGTILTSVLAYLWLDFLIYWVHRFMHRFTWPFHAPHHSLEQLSAINSHNHWVDPLIVGALVGFVGALVDRGYEIIMPVMVLMMLQTYWVHSDLKFGAGPLKYIIVEPAFHRIHHSRDPKHFDKNFGTITPLWDVIFGTAYWPEKDERPDIGLDDFPEPSFKEWWLAPFHYIARNRKAKRAAEASTVREAADA